MKKTIFCLVLLIISLLPGCGGKDRQDKVSLRSVKMTEKHYSQKYYLSLPDREKLAGKVPIVVAVFPDSPERKDWISRFEKSDKNFDFILVFPEFTQGMETFAGKEDLKLIAIFQELKDSYHLEITKIYCAGYREGATFAQRFGMMYPAFIRGVSCIAGEIFTDPNPLSISAPYLILADENSPAYQESEKFKAELSESGYQVELINLPGIREIFSPKAAGLSLEFFSGIKPEGGSE